MFDVTGMSESEQDELLSMLFGSGLCDGDGDDDDDENDGGGGGGGYRGYDGQPPYILCRDGDKISMLQLGPSVSSASASHSPHMTESTGATSPIASPMSSASLTVSTSVAASGGGGVGEASCQAPPTQRESDEGTIDEQHSPETSLERLLRLQVSAVCEQLAPSITSVYRCCETQANCNTSHMLMSAHLAQDVSSFATV